MRAEAALSIKKTNDRNLLSVEVIMEPVATAVVYSCRIATPVDEAKLAPCRLRIATFVALLVCRAAANRVPSWLTQVGSNLRIPDKLDSKYRHFHGQVRRFALDTSDRLWPFSRLFLGLSISE